MKRIIISTVATLCLLTLSFTSMSMMFWYEQYYKPSQSIIFPGVKKEKPKFHQITPLERMKDWNETRDELMKDSWDLDFSSPNDESIC